MRTLSKIFFTTGVTMALYMAGPAFAESAPVYDVDSMPQQFDNADQTQQDLPPPPAPEQEGAYVPKPSAQSDRSNGPRLMPSNEPPPSNLTVEQRVKRVEQQVSNMQNSDAAARIEALQSQVQSLQGQVEQLTHQLQQVQSQQKTLYSDLDKRLSQSNKSPAKIVTSSNDDASVDTNNNAADDASSLTPSDSTKPKIIKSNHKLSAKSQVKSPANDKTAEPSAAEKATTDQPNVAEEQQIYQTAYTLIKSKKYSEAVTALQGMLQKYPTGQFASNAHYWLGELYGLMGKNDQALNEFSTVVKTYTNSPRVSDAQLKIGLIFAAELKWSEAKSTFKKVIRLYPGTASARVASEQLKQIKQAGH